MSARRTAVRLKRVYETPAAGDGYRILVDRLWPRGLTKAAARVDLWMKDVAPSADLRRWFHADLDRWPEFCRRYKAELAAGAALEELRAIIRERSRREGGGVTLVFGARDPERNHALVLLEALGARGRRGKAPRTRASGPRS
ncbi:MAG: DUF488 domain-containing protein [Phycisphaerales bacterium]